MDEHLKRALVESTNVVKQRKTFKRIELKKLIYI